MSMPSEQRVSVTIAGRGHTDWLTYEIESDLMTPADGWHVTLGLPDGKLPREVTPWARVHVAVGGQTVLQGRVDSVEQRVSKGEHTLALTGRDDAAVLVDCSAPLFVAREVTLTDIVSTIVRPLGIAKVRIGGGSFSDRREKITVEPGMTAWDALQRAAEANGMWPWFSPDGTLIVSGPDYAAPPVADLILRRDGKGNNVTGMSVRRDMAERYSTVTVLGQTHGTEGADGQHNLRAQATDTGAATYRPRIVVEPECDTQPLAARRARKLLADGMCAGLTITATVRGHRIADSAGKGLLWQPGQRVRVCSEPHHIDDVYFCTARTFTGGKERGSVTELTLKPDGLWLPDTGLRNGRTTGQALQVVDVW